MTARFCLVCCVACLMFSGPGCQEKSEISPEPPPKARANVEPPPFALGALPTQIGAVARGSLALSPNDRWPVWSDSSTHGTPREGVRVWSLREGHEVARLPVTWHDTALAFSPDSRTVALSAEGTAIQLWDTTTWKRTKVMGDPDSPYDRAYRLVFSPDGRSIAAISHEKGETPYLEYEIRLWDLEQSSSTSLGGFQYAPGGIAFSQDGSLLAASVTSPGRSENPPVRDCVKVWDLRKRKVIDSLDVPRSAWDLGLLAFSQKGDSLVFGGHSGRFLRWNLATRKETMTILQGTSRTRCYLAPRGGSIAALVHDPDRNKGHRVADNTVELWDLDSGQRTHAPRAFPQTVHNAAFTSDGRHLVLVLHDEEKGAWAIHLCAVSEWERVAGR